MRCSLPRRSAANHLHASSFQGTLDPDGTLRLTMERRLTGAMIDWLETEDGEILRGAELRRDVADEFFADYPGIADVGLSHGWHGVTAHTALMRQVAGAVAGGNIHVSAVYNGLGVMPAHNNGYLTACRLTDRAEGDTRFLSGTTGQLPLPGEFYRSLMLKPFMSLMTPV